MATLTKVCHSISLRKLYHSACDFLFGSANWKNFPVVPIDGAWLTLLVHDDQGRTTRPVVYFCLLAKLFPRGPVPTLRTDLVINHIERVRTNRLETTYNRIPELDRMTTDLVKPQWGWTSLFDCVQPLLAF